MRPCRIRISGVTYALILLLFSGAASLLPMHSMAQSCAGTLGSITYDTVYNSATPSTSFNYSLPQFPVSTSTLYAVTFKSTVTASASIPIFNASGATVNNPGVQLLRQDGFNSTVTGNQINSNLFPSPVTSVIGAPIASFTGENVPMPNVVNNVQDVNDSFTPGNLAGFAGFTGGGNIPVTYSANNTPVSTSIGVFPNGPPTVTNTMHFTITYYYCIPPILAIDIVAFTAVRENEETVLLNWLTANEQAGRKYDIEVSTDGANFVSYASRMADPAGGDASYSYQYPVGMARGKLYFRLRMTDVSGPAQFSPVRIIDLGSGGATGFTLYPNPPDDFVQLGFPVTSTGWQVDILAADGSLKQRNYYPNTSQARVNFARRLAAGTYFVRATDSRTMQSYVKPFVIR
jgi:hypothetical protein